MIGVDHLLKGDTLKLIEKSINSVNLLFIILVLIIPVFTKETYKENSSISAEVNRFYSSQHNKLNNENLEKVLDELQISLDKKTLNRWKKLLNKALWYQDLFRFFSSKHHFDNCCFKESLEQISKHQKENETDYLVLQNTKVEKERNRRIEKIIFRIGRILHSAQDFFSHSNFVELMQNKYIEIEEVPIVDFWSETGKEMILDLSKKGLVSEKFLLSFPHKCPKNSLSHQEICKDNSKKQAGRRQTTWLNKKSLIKYTGFEAAMIFADKSTYKILYTLFSTYPLLHRNTTQIAS